jgi:prophage DNA circulation protein
MSTIRDISNPWRDQLLPASFDGNEFHVEAGSRENGRRIVMHEFPKKEFPYAEDMGRRAVEFSVRGYCIQFMMDLGGSSLYRRDYRIARDLLQERLDTGGAGKLQLPTMRPLVVVCPRYRLTEEERLGGYCVFDMTFSEFGIPPNEPDPSTRDKLLAAASAMQSRVLTVVGGGK